MQVISSSTQLKPMKKSTSVAIGIFDGVHSGHYRVITQAVKEAREHNLKCIVLTFSGISGQLENKDPKFEIIMSEELFYKILEEMGVDAVVSLPFNDIKMLSPQDFVRDILKDKLNARFVSTGQDFRFGKNAQGDYKTLEEICKDNGIFTKAITLVFYQGDVISSTKIRECIRCGEIPTANDILGHRYAIDFEVVDGKHLGRTIDTPTINQPYPKGYVVPKFGVYATLTEVDGRVYTSVTNVGTSPTVGGKNIVAETYIQDFEGNLYGRRIKVEFLQFLRKEEKFDSLDSLKKQIKEDSEEARNIGILYI